MKTETSREHRDQAPAMRPFFSKASFGASDTRCLPPCSIIRAQSIVGVVTVKFDDGDEITLSTGDSYKADWALFRKVQITTAAGASATIVYGIGTIQGSGSGTSVGATVQGTSGDPEGVLSAADGQWAYDSATGFLYINPNTSGATGWVALIS